MGFRMETVEEKFSSSAEKETSESEDSLRSNE